VTRAPISRRPRGNSRRARPRAAAKARAEELWSIRKGNGPFSGARSLYLRADRFNGTVSIRQLEEGLEYLAAITDDAAFWSALLALRAYGFGAGGLKQAVKKMLRSGGFAPDDALVCFMRDGSVAEAQRVAAEFGAPSKTGSHATFDQVVLGLRRAYSRMEKDPGASMHMPEGNTGRTLIVRSELLSPDGIGILPDDRSSRPLVADGHASLLGTIEKGNSLQELQNRIEQLRRREAKLVQKSPKDSPSE
jgi:hypothetical protein